MTAEIAQKTSERSAVWVPYVVRRAERTFRKPVVPLVTDAAGGGRRPLLGLVLATSGAVARTADACCHRLLHDF
jgi:hypothetical protein